MTGHLEAAETDETLPQDELKAPADAWLELRVPHVPDEPEAVLDADECPGHGGLSSSDEQGKGSGIASLSSGAAYRAIRQRLKDASQKTGFRKQGTGVASKTELIYGDSAGDQRLSSNGGPREKLIDLVLSTKFELTFAVLIVMNTIIMALQVQYHGLDVGHTLEYCGLDKPAKETWPGAQEVFIVFEWFFGILFTAEIVLKILALDIHFCWDPWIFLVSVTYFVDSF
eukprot:TRINITY_DN18566_c0_g1_i3.p1 TRINITY_DN18566_c0_g1~~TRINITY_DN18566_c0_g1_i3.p1  ORF type:complete len:228 (+),score=37.14 TRINITY_DN18566_c0_g1_i3:22-705(+)